MNAEAPQKADKRVWWRVVERVGPYRSPLILAISFSLFAAAAGAVWASLVGPLLRSLIGGGDITWGPLHLSREDLTFKLPLAIVAAAVSRLAGGVDRATDLLKQIGRRGR